MWVKYCEIKGCDQEMAVFHNFFAWALKATQFGCFCMDILIAVTPFGDN